MSEEAKRSRADEAEEESERSLPANPDLEAALREAVESVDARRAAPRGDPDEPPAGAPAEAPAGEPAEPSAAPAERDELARTRDQLIRLQADFENFRRRSLQERREIHQYGHENLVKDLLSTVDNLERAIDHARESDDGDLEGFLQGVELVQREFLAILEKHFVREIEAMGKPFDPAVHEAMAQLPDESAEPNSVTQVLQKGYQLRDRLLRPARVVVAKAPEREDGGETGG